MKLTSLFHWLGREAPPVLAATNEFAERLRRIAFYTDDDPDREALRLCAHEIERLQAIVDLAEGTGDLVG